MNRSCAWLGFALLLGCSDSHTNDAARAAVVTAPAARARQAPRFDGIRALNDVRKQVAFGPRVANTASHAETSAWLARTLRSLADEVEEDHFGVRELRLVNIIARFRPELTTRVLLCAHWDTRPFANHDPDPSRRGDPVPGAVDGASGVAVLLELARLFQQTPPAIGVDLVLFDGEDYGDFSRGWSDVLLGSQRFATRADLPNYRYGILLDMVGERDLCFPREGYSLACCDEVVKLVWGVAAELGYGHVFESRRGPSIVDDHVPLQLVGVPVIDVIDLDYAWWHTVDDTPDKVSAKSLEIVGSVVAEVVYRER